MVSKKILNHAENDSSKSTCGKKIWVRPIFIKQISQRCPGLFMLWVIWTRRLNKNQKFVSGLIIGLSTERDSTVWLFHTDHCVLIPDVIKFPFLFNKTKSNFTTSDCFFKPLLSIWDQINSKMLDFIKSGLLKANTLSCESNLGHSCQPTCPINDVPPLGSSMGRDHCHSVVSISEL